MKTEVLRNLCEILMKGKGKIDFEKLEKAIDYSYFYDVAIYLEKINEVNSHEVISTDAFLKMTTNDLSRPIKDIFFNKEIPKSLFKYRTLKKNFLKIH